MFTVPIIPSDLRHEETVIKAALALKCLQNTIKCVFDRIDKRVARNNDKVLELQTRVTKVNNKIHSLVGTKKAIKIISPARFPSTHVLKDIPLTFIPVPEEENPSADDIYEIKSRVEAPTQSSIQEKLVLFHVKSTSENTSEYNSSKGLGEIPSNLKSANSLLLYGTSEIVYGNEALQYNTSTMSDKANFSNKPAVKDKRVLMEMLGPAPHSLTNRFRTENREKSISYMPQANDAPQIDVPLDLPDLPGIADDIHFENTEQQQIAPSHFMEILPDLPDTEIKKETNDFTEEDFNKEISENDAHLVQISTPPPPPPPPPPSEQLASTAKLPNQSAAMSSVRQTTPPVLPSLPPPPPPPPMTLRLPSTPPIQAPQGLMDVHSNLMDAIRRAGGTQGGKLRNAASTANAEANASARNAKSAGGGDLMADLHNKLLMRRKGISGSKDGVGKITTTPPTNRNASTSNGSKDVFSSLSAVIPIEVPNRQQNGSDNDEDDDDGNDNETDWVD